MKLEGISNVLKVKNSNAFKDNQSESDKIAEKKEIHNAAKHDNINKKGKDLEDNAKFNEKTVEFLEEKANEVAEKLNSIISMIDKKLEFTVHEDTNRTIYRIINRETDEILKEFPPEKILDLVGKMMEMAGLFVDEKV